MAGRIHRFLASVHARLDDLLNRALAKPDTFDYETYGEFRAELLKYIAMEEKVLLPAAQRKHGGEPETPEIVRRQETMAEVSLAGHVNGPQVMEAMRRALSRAGYPLAEAESNGPSARSR